jgi:oligosaccharyltransferase complex subunit beta
LFFSELSSRGHKLTYHAMDSSRLKLKAYGEYNYDNIVFFAPTAEKLGSLAFDEITAFSNAGGNVLIAASKDVSDSVRDLIESFGVTLHKKGYEVIDHFETLDDYDLNLQHTHFLAREASRSPALLGAYGTDAHRAPVLFHGIGQSLADPENILAVPALRGNPSSYSAQPNKPVGDGPESSGEETYLVTAVQGRNNARVVVAGSLDLFSNAYFRATDDNQVVGNEVFCRESSKWALAETAVLRYRDIRHHRSDGVPPDVILHEKTRPDLPVTMFPDPELTRNSLIYRIKDEIVYSMVVEEYTNGRWVPFNATDMQMEFVMLDPYVRKTMTADAQGTFSAVFTAPDSYGIFKFRVLYRRPGYSVLHAETKVSLRPFKHNEYERFIFSAYPYYTSAISATVAFFVFSVAFLFSKETK